jgi:hypothetical protein
VVTPGKGRSIALKEYEAARTSGGQITPRINRVSENPQIFSAATVVGITRLRKRQFSVADDEEQPRSRLLEKLTRNEGEP